MIATVLDQGGMFYTGEIDSGSLAQTRVLLKMSNPLVPTSDGPNGPEFKPIGCVDWIAEVYLLPVRVIPRNGVYVEAYREALTKLRDAFDRNLERQGKRLSLA